MSALSSLKEHTPVNMLVSFVDLTLYTKAALSMEDQAVAKWMDAFFEKLEKIISASGGIIVKYIGDAALIVFEERLAEQGILCLLDAKTQIDDWLSHDGYASRLQVKIHFGQAIAGPFGGKGNKRFDVIGSTVNAAATLREKPFCISAQAFRQLSAEGRKHFKKHTPPITYIRLEDRHG